MFQQSTRDQDYLNQCNVAEAQALQSLINAYLYPRAVILGLPIPQGANPQGERMFARSGDGTVFPLADRIKVFGKEWAGKMMLAEELRQTAEKMIKVVLDDLGGITAVRENGPWSFLLNLAERDPKTKKVLSYKGLPTNPYEQPVLSPNPGEAPRVYEVTLGANEDGTGTVSFKLIGETQSTSNDPF